MDRRRKRIKFPLEMKDGRKVRELDEFIEYFDLGKAVEYFCSGKLQAWFDNIYASDIVEELNKLTGEEDDFVKRFTEILGVECVEEIDVREIIHNAFLKEKLKRFYPEEESELMAGRTADTQERFEELLKDGEKEIYLLSGTFTILKRMNGLKLTGLDSPRVVIKAQTAEEFREQNITMKGIEPVDEETKRIMSSDELSAVANEMVDVLEMYLQKISQEEGVC